MPRLEDDDLVYGLEARISVAEIETAIQELSSNKSPGPDGLGASIYKAFRTEMAVALERLFSECYENKVTPPSFRTSHVILIPKANDPIRLVCTTRSI